MKKIKFLTAIAVGALAVGATATLTSCGGFEGVMIWGPIEHQELYLAAVDAFKKANPEFTAEVRYAGSGDAGAYAAMAIDPQNGGSIVTFPNDQLINLKRIGALAPLSTENTAWIKENNDSTACEAGKISEKYYAYPISADNGYVLTYNADAFKDTAVWDSTTQDLKAGYTFRDLYTALDERGAQTGHEKWANGLAIWPEGSAWYESGMFFGTGGDYSVTYDDKGVQTSASCNFNGDIGTKATRCMVNSFTNTDGSINKHFMYTDDSNPAYNDTVTKYINESDTEAMKTPLAAIVTWNNGALKKGWGENYRATVLPTLEDKAEFYGAANQGDGIKYTWKTFAGFKLMGVNPFSTFASKSEENLSMLHKLAKYLSDSEVSLARFKATSLGPSNKTAQKDAAVQADKFLKALSTQYNLNDGQGCRVQDPTPSAYWTPIATYGKGLFDAVQNGTKGTYDTIANVKRALNQLQADIQSTTK